MHIHIFQYFRRYKQSKSVRAGPGRVDLFISIPICTTRRSFSCSAWTSSALRSQLIILYFFLKFHYRSQTENTLDLYLLDTLQVNQCTRTSWGNYCVSNIKIRSFQHKPSQKKRNWLTIFNKKKDFKGPIFNQNRDQYKKRGKLFQIL